MVGKVCTVCKSCSYAYKDLSFFSYPGNPKRRYEWLKAVNRLDLLEKLENSRIRGNHRICEIHFEGKYVQRSVVSEGRKYLTKDAFPTLNLDITAPPTVVPVPMTNENLLRPPNSVAANKENIRLPKIPIMENWVNIRTTSPPPGLADLSEFCESIIKVSKGTQTRNPVIKNQVANDNPEFTIEERHVEDKQTVTKQSFLELCYKFLPESMSQIIKWHLSSSKCLDSVNSNLFALNLFYSSNSYSMLNDILSLPTLDSLRHFLVPQTTKMSKVFIKALKIKVSSMSPSERICSFSIGSIYLKPYLYYDIKYDRIIGLHDVDGEQLVQPAKYAIVLMVQGILENWKQPIAYSFISEYDNFPIISMWIDSVIAILLDIGLDIRAFISDPKSENLYLSETRSVTPDKTYFTIRGRNIFYIYDSRHLLKVVKNNMKSCDYYFSGQIPKKDDTSNFFKKLNNLCDLLNARSPNSDSPFKRAYSNKKYQTNFMDEMLMLLMNLKVIRKKDNVDVTENMKFVNNFQISIKSVMQLYSDLDNLGVRHMLTSRLSHINLDKFFINVKKIVGKHECTAREFNKCFVRSFVFSLLKRPFRSCSVDNSSEVEHLLNEDETEGIGNNLNKPLRIYTTDYRLGLPEKNAFVYVCGYCYMKCLQRHRCETLKTYLKTFHQNQDKDVPYLCSVKLDFNVNNYNILPPDNFGEFLMLLETKFKEFFQPDVEINSVGQEILSEMANLEFSMPCPCFPIDYLKALFIRLRIYYTVRKNNKMFKRKKCAKMFRVFSL